MDHIWKVTALSIGGVIGVNARYWLGHWMNQWADPKFPWATFTINVTGSFAIGFVTIVLARWLPHANAKLLLVAGLLGGYTTFSAYSFESLAMWERGDRWYAASYVVGSVLAGLIAVAVGAYVARVVAPEVNQQAVITASVIWAIRLQTKELELQRLKIEETRDELKRSADAQTLSQQMHFLSALLSARNNVAQGYAVAAARESGSLQLSQMAHRQHLAELEWLLHQVDRHGENPFALPPIRVLVAHQAGMLLARAHPVLQSALSNRAANHARSLLLDLNHALRELRRLLSGEAASDFSKLIDESLTQAETVAAANEFSEIATVCRQVFNQLSGQVARELGTDLPTNGT